MDAIKKKMQAMKLEKDNAMDRADTCEQQARDANLRAEKVMPPPPKKKTQNRKDNNHTHYSYAIIKLLMTILFH